MYIVAIIPARGGSKGIPLKNIRQFNGKPLVATSIDAALKSKYVNEVYVSTDDERIATASKICGAEVIKRPAELGADTASSESALLDGLSQLEAKGKHPDILVFLQCTAPFMTADDIDGTVEKMIEENADSALAVVPFNHFLWKKNKEKGASGINHDGLYRKRRQDLESQFLESGSVYCMKVESFIKEKTRFCGKTALFEINDPAREHEIDDASEFYIAEKKLEWFKKTEKEKEFYRTKALLFESNISKIKAVVFDFDGIFTDDSVYIDEHGKESIRCSRSDGFGLENLRKETKLKLIVISKESNSCVIRRCEKLKLDAINSCENKLDTINNWAICNGLNMSEILYCGNDLNDASMLGKVGLFCCPYNSNDKIKAQADYCSNKIGASGFVREICDLLLQYKNVLISNVCEYKVGEHDSRPWGSWKVIESNEKECIKLITVLPDKRLSYQSHNFRNELWLIKKGEASVTIDGREFKVSKDDVIKISKKEKHRIKNISTNEVLEIIEIQTGDVLSEKDIIRYEDDFGRMENQD